MTGLEDGKFELAVTPTDVVRFVAGQECEIPWGSYTMHALGQVGLTVRSPHLPERLPAL